jgi:hypothetical protein
VQIERRRRRRRKEERGDLIERDGTPEVVTQNTGHQLHYFNKMTTFRVLKRPLSIRRELRAPTSRPPLPPSRTGRTKLPVATFWSSTSRESGRTTGKKFILIHCVGPEKFRMLNFGTDGMKTF